MAGLYGFLWLLLFVVQDVTSVSPYYSYGGGSVATPNASIDYGGAGYGSGYGPPGDPTLYTHDDSFHPDVILRITGVQFPIDCTIRYSILINGTYPGPLLRFVEGQHVWIRVYNDIPDDNFTMHWHGLTQRMSPFSDGTPAASQWPIPPMHYFDYEFMLQDDDAGTYFYHSHVGYGASTAAGGLIVDEGPGKKPPFVYDDERIMLVNNVLHLNDSTIVSSLQHMAIMRSTFAVNNIGINGQTRNPDATPDQAGPSCQHAVITIDPEKTYRFRIIGGMSSTLVYLAFEGHTDLTVIEADGKYVMPQRVDSIQLHSGQRYSILIRGKKAAVVDPTGYWIQMESRAEDSVTTGYAVLAYSNHPVTDTFSLPSTPPLVLPNESFADTGFLENLQAWFLNEDNPFPTLAEVTRRVYVTVQLITSDAEHPLAGFINYVQDKSEWFESTPEEPYLVSLYKNATKYFPNYDRAVAAGGFDNITKVFPVKIGEVLEIVWLNTGAELGVPPPTETHPMHAHGDHFYDLGTGNGNYDPVANEARVQSWGGHGATRDTTILYRVPDFVPPGQVATWGAWRIRARNAGVWMIHCHILAHMIMGFQSVWVFGETKDLTPLPMELAAGYLTYGGSSNGNATFSPRVVEFWKTKHN